MGWLTLHSEQSPKDVPLGWHLKDQKGLTTAGAEERLEGGGGGEKDSKDRNREVERGFSWFCLTTVDRGQGRYFKKFNGCECNLESFQPWYKLNQNK